MTILSRWLAPAALAAGLGFGAMTPAPVQAQDTLTRVLVDVADVVLRGGVPYYRQGDYGYDDRLITQRDPYGRVVYYRTVPRYDVAYNNGYRSDPYGYRSELARKAKCNKHGKCKVTYYDPSRDRSGRYQDERYAAYRYDRDGRYWDGRRWRDSDD